LAFPHLSGHNTAPNTVPLLADGDPSFALPLNSHRPMRPRVGTTPYPIADSTVNNINNRFFMISVFMCNKAISCTKAFFLCPCILQVCSYKWAVKSFKLLPVNRKAGFNFWDKSQNGDLPGWLYKWKHFGCSWNCGKFGFQMKCLKFMFVL
jgi:hypothetical protein